ncbi:hypothetical protein Rleg_5964 (plasmid) [Rhizobium leguminosarum bv. trifolii WSM1325]|uniref:Uncharacterized protein n=1 Tax=Rhizobium leguminosarum bv. trifolii (strain WSM1325) TaxID=395491 RepID=C6B8J4_RHILS|nr:hypothetical protein Rleg_5964 [Rhizobium leguminosarum bv. trifolii WSM1325]
MQSTCIFAKSARSLCGFVLALSVLGMSGSAMAQTNEVAKDCRVKPDTERAKNLSGQLDDCNGVLKPPKIGDEIVTPAPSTGTMPVIKPGDLPANKSHESRTTGK